MPKFWGFLDQAFGGYTCLRGFATIRDIDSASFADDNFQRKLIPERATDIKEYLEHSSYLFFPEVILSLTLNENMLEGFRKIAQRQKGKLQSKEYTLAANKQLKNALQVANLGVNKGKKVLSRIDGNHRIEYGVQTNKADTLIPFCIIIFQSKDAYEEASKIIFHNINFKAVPLKGEKNLRMILDDTKHYNNAALQTQASFGWHFYFARRFFEKITLENLPHISLSFLDVDNEDCSRSVITELFALLLRNGVIAENDISVDKVIQAMQKLNAQEEICTKLSTAGSNAVVILFVYYSIYSEGKLLEVFIRWIMTNHIYNVKNTSAEHLLEVFEQFVTSRKRQVFVAMQFYNNDERYMAIEEAVNDVNIDSSSDLQIKIEPVRIDKTTKGHSFVITDEILQVINDSGLLIADLSDKNINVYYEIGYLMGLNSGKQLSHENFILLMKNQDGETERNVGFDLRSWQQIRFTETTELRRKLSDSIRIYYGLSKKHGS